MDAQSEPILFLHRDERRSWHASDSEVIRDGLRALQARDKAVENWLRTEIAASYDEMKADPSKGRTPEQVLASLKA